VDCAPAGEGNQNAPLTPALLAEAGKGIVNDTNG
jgi:hypothetical protein